MDFNHFLTSYMPNPNVGSKVHFQNMIEQSILAEKLGFKKVSIPEHHLINLLMMPSPLQMAVKIASLTKNISISTSVAVLPLHDMRTYAGEVATADILTDGRLILGVARGAFPWEMKRLGTPIEHSKEKFTESLEVLQKLLSEEEVSFSGKYYNFETLKQFYNDLCEIIKQNNKYTLIFKIKRISEYTDERYTKHLEELKYVN